MGLGIGSAWAAAMVGGWTILHLARDEQMRRAAVLSVFSFVAILVAKGAYQVYVEHAYTVAAYKKDSAAMLAAQGLTEGSTGAKEYERRLFQPEPLGWFGLSNVYATLVAASFIFFLGLSIGAWKLVKAKLITSGPAGAMSLAALASLFALYLSGSKGGWGAMLAGGVVLLVGSLSPWERMSRPSETGEGSVPTRPTFLSSLFRTLLPLLLCLSTLAMVALRGAIGERLHELSLLFRWHYLVAATRIFASESLFGVGPMGFKNAYALHKVPINPEMVESPHSVFFDWAATLGAFGLCWGFVLIWMLRRIGTFLSSPRLKTQDSRPPHWRSSAPVLIVVAVASAFAWFREAPIITADEWPLRLIALAVCLALIVIGTKIAALAPRAFTVSLAAAACVVAVHSMIEMTPTQPGSCMLAMLMLACGASAVMPGVVQQTKSRMLASVLLPQPPLVVAIFILGVSVVVADRKETALRKAAALAVDLTTVQRYLDSDQFEQHRGVAMQFATRLGYKSGFWGDGETDPVRDKLLDARGFLARDIGAQLLVAYWPQVFGDFAPKIDPSFSQVADEYIRFDVLAGMYFKESKLGREKPTRFMPFQMTESFNHSTGVNGSVAMMSRLASGWHELAKIGVGADSIHQALNHWLRVIHLDPYSLTPALSAYRLARELNDTAIARDMAARALRNNAYLRLDPLKQLDPAQVADLERFLAETTPNPSQTPPAEPANPPPPT